MKIVTDRRSTRADLKTTRHAIIFLAGVLAYFVVPASARAGLLLQFSESGNDVTATVSGSIDTAGLTMYGSVSLGHALVNPSIGYFHNSGTTDSNGVAMNFYKTFSGPLSWGSGGADGMVATYSGDAFLINMGYGGYIELPYFYVSGSPIVSSVLWSNASFSSMGLDPGTYTYTWGSGPTADSMIVQVGAGGPVAVPEPSSAMLAGLGGATALTFIAFRRRRVAI